MANQTVPFHALNPTARVREVRLVAGATAPEVGQWLIQDTAGDAEYYQIPADGASNADNWGGVISEILSAVTATADGRYLIFDAQDTTFRGPATTSGNLATSILNTKVTMDVNSSYQTVDENDTTNGVLFVEGFDADAGTIDVRVDVDNLAMSA
jgi:hypothetical protein